MANLTAGQTENVFLSRGDTLNISGNVEVFTSPGIVSIQQSAGSYGPFDSDRTIIAKAISNAAYWMGQTDVGVPAEMEKRFYAFPFTTEGCQAAEDAASASVGGTVVYAGVRYKIASSIQARSYVNRVGQMPGLNYVAASGPIEIPDVTFAAYGGTIFEIANGVECFTFNSNDIPAQLTDLATQGITSSTWKNMAFVGGKGAIKLGALYAMGPLWCQFSDLYFFNQTDYHFHVENYQHCQFHNFWSKNNLSSTGGYHYYTSVSDPVGPTGLIPGNSSWTGEHYSYTTSLFAKNYVFYARGLADCQMNELAINARMQANRYGDVATDYSVTTVGGGSPNVVLAVPSDIVKFPVGMPLVFTSGTPQFLAAGAVYFVNTNNGVDTITLSPTPSASLGYAGVTITNAASFTVKSSGWPALIAYANATSLINNTAFGDNWDIEAASNVCAVMLSRVFSSTFGLHEIMPSVTNTAIVARSASVEISCRGLTNVTTDFDDQLNNIITVVKNKAGGYRYLTAGLTLTRNYHDCDIYIENAGAQNVTVPDLKLGGFKCRITQLGAGQLTVVGSGVTVNGRLGLKTAGQYSPIELRMSKRTSYIVSGDAVV